jgi:hypothetical protein
MRSSRHQQGAAGYSVKFRTAFDLSSTLFGTVVEGLIRGHFSIIAIAHFGIKLADDFIG